MAVGRVPAILFWLSILLELGVVAFCALWPIREHLRHAQSLQHYIDLYSIDSNLDVWAQSLLHCLMLPFCFLRVAGQNRRHRRRYASARLAISSIVYLCQVTLLEVVSDCTSSLFLPANNKSDILCFAALMLGKGGAGGFAWKGDRLARKAWRCGTGVHVWGNLC